MNPVLLYFKERPFTDNKFILDFSDKDQNVNSIEFQKNSQYLFATLNCNLKHEKIIHTHNNDNKKAVSDLSKKSRILLDKGIDYFCDIDNINLTFSPKQKSYEIVEQKNNFYFERKKNFKNYTYKYKFWDEKEKKVKDAEIFSPYSQLTAKGLYFTQKGTNIQYVVRLDKDIEEIHSYFYSDKIRDLTYNIGHQWYRDINLFFVFDDTIPDRFAGRRQRWFSTNIDFFNEMMCQKTLNSNFKEFEFVKKYFHTDKKGDKVIGTYTQRLQLGSKKFLMPIIYLFGSLKIMPNEPFYTSDTLNLKSNTFLKDVNIRSLGLYRLTDSDIADIKKSVPNFQLHELHKFVCINNNISNSWKDELFFYPNSTYRKSGQPEYSASLMLARADKKAFKYRAYLNSDRNIFKKPYFKKIPSTLAAAELLFDKDVLEIKELVKKTQKIITEENYPDSQRNFVLYDNSDIVKETFFTELKKNISAFGLFSTRHKKKSNILLDSQNRIEFIVRNTIKKQFLNLQLENLLEPKTIATEDSKMSNITILKVGELPKKMIVENFFIQGLQRFDKYKKLNPLNIEIIDTEIRNKISLYARSNYRYIFRFIANGLLFSSNLKKDTNCIFIVSDTLRDAQTLFINDESFQGLGAIYTSEIENWEDIKVGSHWTAVKLTDNSIPIGAKHFSFGFETKNINNLFNFKYSLLNDDGEIIEFRDGETKVPTLNFSIQILA